MVLELVHTSRRFIFTDAGCLFHLSMVLPSADVVLGTLVSQCALAMVGNGLESLYIWRGVAKFLTGKRAKYQIRSTR